MKRTLITRLAIAILFTVILTGVSSAQTTPGEFTIVALPDTQMYSKSYPQIFASETKWIADNAAAMNIKLVVGLGDIVDSGGEIGQWQNADAAMRNIDYKVPFMMAIGNHDYDRNDPAGRTASATNFNSVFGPARFADRAWYRGQFPAGSNENSYSIFSFSGTSYLVLMLEVFPRDSAISWASNIIRTHPSSKVILVTHSYIYFDNTRLDRCDINSAGSFSVGRDNDGQQVWEKLVSKYANITMVLSGHVVQGDGTGRRSDLGTHGNLVNQILSNYQSWQNGGNGYIRIITIKPALNQVSVRTYSPYLNQSLTDDHHQFTLPLQNVGLVPAAQAIHGEIKSTNDCSKMASVSVGATSGSATTDLAGKFNIASAGPQSYRLAVQRAGYITMAPPTASTIPGLNSPAKIFMSPAGVLSGTVSRAGVPLMRASVTLSGGALRSSVVLTTSTAGTFQSGKIAVGTYDVTVRVAGLATLHGVATVNTGVTTTYNASLK